MILNFKMHITPGAGISRTVVTDLCHFLKLSYTSQASLVDKRPLATAGDPHKSPFMRFFNSCASSPHSCALESPSSSTTSIYCVSEFIFTKAKTIGTLTLEGCSKHKLYLVQNIKNIWPRAWYPLPQPLLTLCRLWGPGHPPSPAWPVPPTLFMTSLFL